MDYESDMTEQLSHTFFRNLVKIVFIYSILVYSTQGMKLWDFKKILI